jgi:fluoride exporter
VAVGGGIGALTRVAVEREFPVHRGAFPWSTFVINIVGCVILAYVATRLLERLPPSTYRRPAIGTGFCGALTTFSTLQVEVFQLLRDGDVGLAVLYAASSIAAGFAAVILATWTVRRARLVRTA